MLLNSRQDEGFHFLAQRQGRCCFPSTPFYRVCSPTNPSRSLSSHFSLAFSDSFLLLSLCCGGMVRLTSILRCQRIVWCLHWRASFVVDSRSAFSFITFFLRLSQTFMRHLLSISDSLLCELRFLVRIR
jgi:hypothetical protein